MLRIIPDGEGKAKLIRNKRRGVRLKVVVDLSHTGSYCENCWLNDNFAIEDNCMDTVCRDFEKVTGTKKFWFERDEGKV